jgi:dipeptide/tripeptide permease
LSTILGGWLADRLLGAERTLFYAAVVVMAGHIALALIPGLAGVAVGLVLIGFGSGGVKANATSLVGTLYAENDDRRDGGFSLFYLGINLGALAGPLLTGLLQDNAGFHYGFGLAAAGMFLGLVQYGAGRGRLTGAAREVPNPLPSEALRRVALIVLSGVFAALWTKLGSRQPSTPVKFSAGLAVMGIAFLLFLTMAGGGPNSAPLLGLAGILLVFTIAELLLSPVGLSLSTKLAPEAFRTQMVALFFLSVALGTAMSGVLAKLYSTDHETAYFGVIGAAALLLGGLLALAVRPIRNLMSGIH